MESGDAPSSAGSSKPWRNRVKYELSNEDMFDEIRSTLNSSTGKRLSLQRRLSKVKSYIFNFCLSDSSNRLIQRKTRRRMPGDH
jgi:hypothetical protein